MENKETLEDFIKSIFPSPSGAKIRGIELGAEWQAKRMYSEEDMRKAFEWGIAHITFEEWLEEFKKKQ